MIGSVTACLHSGPMTSIERILRRMAGTAATGPDRKQLERLAGRLRTCTRGVSEEVPVLMSAVATYLLVQGAPAPLGENFLRSVQARRDSASVISRVWCSVLEEAPFLEPHLPAILGWVDRGEEQHFRAFRDCLRVLAEQTPTGVCGGVENDLLGEVYSHCRSSSTQRDLGAFYTPPTLNDVLAGCLIPAEHSVVLEPACGAGGMVVATARNMRRSGLDPSTCRWVLVDIDPVAVALAGVNAVVHGLGERVELRVGDALSVGRP